MRIMIEVLVDRGPDQAARAEEAFNIASARLSELVNLDPAYPPVPVQPGSDDLSLVGPNQQLVLVRGQPRPTVTIDMVRELPQVIRVWRDDQVTAFPLEGNGPMASGS